MVPTPQEHKPRGNEGVSATNGDRVVISGMSGLYPQSQHIQDLSDILYGKINPITEGQPRWNYDHPEVSPFVGTAPNLENFDAQFFKVHFRLGMSMDSMGRKILEKAYEAIYDSGMNPKDLSGKKIGVYIGSCFSETEKACFYVATSRTGLGIAGCNKSMFANRVSYWLNAKGPSQSIDAACCSSTVALEQAYLAMSRGDCEAAIVGGANVCLHPQSSLHYARTITLCNDGKTKSYDQNADGCARSEAINVLFLQKAKDAFRIYADVVHVKNKYLEMVNNDTGPRYGFYRDPVTMSGFLKEFYSEAKISPEDVEYVEGFGSANAEADKVELEVFDRVFCKDRTKPLFVGSVMSNLGYGEAASGITAITKVLLGYHKGQMAGNLHCTTPRQDVEALREGRMRILDDHQPFQRTFVGVNGVSVTGINSHVLLHGHYKQKDLTRYQCDFPRLVLLSARQEAVVQNVINHLKSKTIDPEELALLHNIHYSKINGHLGRGFTILDTNENKETVSLCESVNYFDGSDRPLWFVYSGMGSQWAGMGASLMRLPIFAAAIERCKKVLEPKGIDIVHIITSPDKKIYDNILHSFVGIAAIQIGLTDVLRQLGLVPDKIIGHSVGELGCAYADGCLTAEEMILSAYSRGLVSVQTPFIQGSMAAVGIGFTEVSKMCPPEIEVACHNGPDSSTISGPADAMREFVAQLTAKGIFAKEVPCSNIAYHSRYIADAGPGLLKYLSEVIKTPKPRSERWLSTSIPEERWNEEAAQFSSAEYHTNNLLNPVLFEETSRLVPPTAVLVEVAPHGLLQAILKRSLPPSCVHIPLTRRGHPDNARFLLEAIGKLYMEGYYPDVRILYPKIEFPVSTGTPHLSHLVEWAHNEKWFLPLYVTPERKAATACKFVISLHDREHNFLKGHVIRGRTLYPFSGALVAVWDTLVMSLGATRRQISVQFRDVQLFAQPILHDSRQLRLSVTLHRGTGLFEVMDDNTKVASGYIIALLGSQSSVFKEAEKAREPMDVTAEDVYKILYEREYSYKGEFQSIYNTNASFTDGHLLWDGNWVTFIDGMLQLCALKQPHRGVSQPTRIRKIIIDIKQHLNDKIIKIDNASVMKTSVCTVQDNISCGGVLMANVMFREIVSLDENKLAIKVLSFVPRFQTVDNLNIKQALQVFVQIVHENISNNVMNVVDIYDRQDEHSVYNDIKNIISELPGINIRFQDMRKSDIIDNLLKEADLVLVRNLSGDDNMCQTLYRLLRRNVFAINVEHLDDANRIRPSALYRVVSAQSSKETRLELLKWRPKTMAAGTSTFTVRTHSDLLLLQTARSKLPSRHRMIILSPYPLLCGLKEIVQQWRKESDRNQIHLISFESKTSENMNMDQLPELDLVFNVLLNDEWGGEYYGPLHQKLSIDSGIALKSARIGDLESLDWIETSRPARPGVPVKVHFAGLNITDVQRAYGEIPLENEKYEEETYYGMDFSGKTDSGHNVMGLVEGGALSDSLIAQPELLWPVPEHWSLEDAATVPLPYAHAFYCVAVKIQLRYGQSILVHGGTGALGQAVISIALHLKCEVYAAVSDIHKKRFLLKLFPDLKEDHIVCSRDRNFADLILSSTNGKGCLYVITCDKGEIKTACLQSCGYTGVTLDTSSLKNRDNYILGIELLSYDRSYIRVDFSSILRTGDTETMKKLHGMVTEGIKVGYVRPLSRVIYATNEAARAFRLLAARRHRGRVLLRMQPTLSQLAVPRLVCSTNRSHVLLGDEEGPLLQLADTLVRRGARSLHLHFQTSAPLFYPIFKIWEKLGVKIQISSEDLSNSKNVLNLVNKSSRMGLVEGIYVMVTQQLDDKMQKYYQSLVVNLDAVARKSCPTMKYFTICGINNSIGKEICLSRERDRLPAMMLQVIKVDSDLVNSKTIANAVEQGLCSMQTMIVAHRVPQTRTISLLEEITTKAGVTISKDTKENATLQDLGITLDGARAVSSLLRDTESVSIDVDNVFTLSIEKIRTMHKTLRESDYTPKKGLFAQFSYVDPDELRATIEMVPLTTLAQSGVLRDDEFHTCQLESFLCIVPGLEGYHGRYGLMCERLKLPAFVLQPGLDKPNETLQEMSQRLAKTFLKTIDGNKKFYLLGYEMGVLTVLEIAAILEDHGLTGTVFCLGGGPDEFQAALEEQLCEATKNSTVEDPEQALQNAVIRHMFALMGHGGSPRLEAALRDTTDWTQKVSASMYSLRGCVSFTAQYTRVLIEAAYARITLARLHARAQAETVPRALDSRVVLLRSPHSSATLSSHPLQRYSRLPLAIHELQAPLTCAPDDLRVAAIINQYLDSDVLQQFESKNLCETYLVHSDVFMTT